MAGVGFELRKLFKNNDGYVDNIKAYSISAIVTEGPMFLCIFMLLMLKTLICKFNGTYFEKDLFIVVITYSMIFSMLFSNTINMFVSRYISDCIYEKRYDDILSAFYSSVIFVLLFGGTTAGIFIYKLQLNLLYKIIIFTQFNIIMVTWIQLTFLSAIKKYINILKGFFIAVTLAIILALALMVLDINPLLSALLGNMSGYFILLAIFMIEIKGFYPADNIDIFKILGAVDKYKILVFIGVIGTVGLYGHNFIMWASDYSESILEKIRFCIMYDVPAFYASLTITLMLVMFTVSLETNFYIKFRDYFDCILCGGRLKDIKLAHKNMVNVLMNEILKLCNVQLFFTIIAAVFGVTILQYVGMDSNMSYIFRILCFGYYFYGVQKSIVIILLYFDDKAGALITECIFFAFSVILTILSKNAGIDYYGLGFLFGGAIAAFSAFIRLQYYLKNLEYNVFCRQPLFIETNRGIFTRLSERLSNRISRAKL